VGAIRSHKKFPFHQVLCMTLYINILHTKHASRSMQWIERIFIFPHYRNTYWPRLM